MSLYYVPTYQRLQWNDAIYLAVFWMLNAIGWITFYWHRKHIMFHKIHRAYCYPRDFSKMGIAFFPLVSGGKDFNHEYSNRKNSFESLAKISSKNIKLKISNRKKKQTNFKSLTLVCEEIICWFQHQGIPCHHFQLYLYNRSHYQLIHHKFLFQEQAALFYHSLQHDPWNALVFIRTR